MRLLKFDAGQCSMHCMHSVHQASARRLRVRSLRADCEVSPDDYIIRRRRFLNHRVDDSMLLLLLQPYTCMMQRPRRRRHARTCSFEIPHDDEQPDRTVTKTDAVSFTFEQEGVLDRRPNAGLCLVALLHHFRLVE